MAATLHADHVGSLLRPAELIEARRQSRDGKISRTELEAAEDAAILKALNLQKQAGIEIFTGR